MSKDRHEAKNARNAADYPERLIHRADPFWGVVLREMRDYGVHVLNTSIVPPGADGSWEVRTVTNDFARDAIGCAITTNDEGSGYGLKSHVGHQATADVIGALMGGMIFPVDREPWDGTGIGLALQLHGRIPEGAILTVEEMQKIGFTWRTLLRRSDSAAPALPMLPLTEYIILLSSRVAFGGNEVSDREKELYISLGGVI